MSGCRLRAIVISVALLAIANVASAQTLTAKVNPSGLIVISEGNVEVGTIELNAHGVAWKHAPQSSATAQVSDLPEGKRIVGTLPIPDTNGGVLRYTETVKALPQALQLEYDVSLPAALKLSGLQLSILLPTARYGGQALLVAQPDGDPLTITMPAERREGATQVWAGEAARVEVAKGTPAAMAIEMRASTDVLIQDLRQWEHQTFEVRFPAIAEDGGREVTPEDRFHLDLTIKLAAPVKLVGP
jgi:hypothetical protein